MHGIWTGSAIAIYQNGTQVGSTTSVASIKTCTGNDHIGQGFNNYNGDVEEFRYSGVARSADWIKTDYNSQNSPSTFYSVGTEESLTSINKVNDTTLSSISKVLDITTSSISKILDQTK